MKAVFPARHIKPWIVDDLACPASGMDENKKLDWNPANARFLELRFAGQNCITGQNHPEKGLIQPIIHQTTTGSIAHFGGKKYREPRQRGADSKITAPLS